MRFSHTKTALCDRCGHAEPFCCQYRTQHCVCRDQNVLKERRMPILCFNAARSIVCVGTAMYFKTSSSVNIVNTARGIMCVGTKNDIEKMLSDMVSMPHAALCVSGPLIPRRTYAFDGFQCRTRHYVCRDTTRPSVSFKRRCFNAARGIMCVGTTGF